MKSSKSVKLVLTGLIGCGICCLPLLLPAAAGVLALSVFSISIGSLVCALFLIFLAIALFGIYLKVQQN